MDSILDEIRILVSDKLQVVSYKWLSRNFSVSSNDAKRLLEEFVEKYGNEVEVVYSLSGWSKKNLGAYHVVLTSENKLVEVKNAFKEGCSVQVYSVQASIPKDPAATWNAEFMQAQELFSQPRSVDNCLRDNRYCGVLNLCVKRDIDGKASDLIQLPKYTVGITLPSKSKTAAQEPSKPKPQTLGADKNLKSGADEGNVKASIHNGVSAKELPKLSNKNNIVNEKNSTAGSALANLWGQTSTKLKSNSPSVEVNNSVVKQEKVSPKAEKSMISDDEEEVRCTRRSNGRSNRKRKVFFASDEENDDENIVSLSSPESASLLNTKNTVLEEQKLIIKSEEEKKSKIDPKPEKIVTVKQEKAVRNQPKVPLKIPAVPIDRDAPVTSTAEKIHHQHPKRSDDDQMNVQTKKTPSPDPKRKKVLKTRVDDRGREVTEVVWEGNAGETDKTTAPVETESAGNARPTLSKAQPVAPAPIPASKTGTKKSVKGGGKDAKQGNILSFFKKVS